MTFSIIIPTLNEAQTIQDCLLALQKFRPTCELIVVDGGSTDDTLMLAQPLADKVLTAPMGRSRQMNSGAQHAIGTVLIFLHADTRLPDNALQLLERHIMPTAQWGRFDIALSGKAVMLKVIAFMMNSRSRLTGIATGDQVIFVTRQAFERVGSYPDIALMEDIALCQRLKTITAPICLAATVRSSGRRWERYGVWHTILLMWWLRWRYFCGANPTTLAQLYNKGSFWMR